MEHDYDPILAPEPRSSAPAPFWVWLLVVALGALTIYSGYTALSARQLYLEGENVRTDLTQQRDRLKANVADLARQVEQANRARDEVENALKQSRANTEAASAQIADLQKQVGDLQKKLGEAESARDAAAAGVKDTTAAKDTAEREANSLKQQLADAKKQLADLQKKLDAARADLAKERQQISPTPMPPPAAPTP